VSVRLRIAILTPGALGSNPRVVKEAQALHEAGHRVTVISTRTLGAVETLDDAVLATCRWTSVRIDFRSRSARAPRRLALLLNARAFSATGAPSFAARGCSIFTGSLLRAALHVEADLYIGHYPAGLVAAARAAARRRVAYAFDAEDFHLGEHPSSSAYDGNRRLIRSIESSYLPSCSHVTAASPGIADAYESAYGIAKPTVLLNVFPLRQAPPAATPRGIAAPGPSIYWFSQTIGPDRGLECAVRAIGLAASKPHLYLRGTPVPGFVEKLYGMAAGAEDRLHILPPAAPSEMELLASEYDIGFVGENGNTLNRKIALTNKQFTYILSGLPILMSDVPSHRIFSQEIPGASQLYPVEDSEFLARSMDEWLMNGTVLAAARRVAWEFGQKRFNWEFERHRLLEALPCFPAVTDHAP
jgi:hypothetical protein